MDSKLIGARLTMLRIDSGMTQKQVGEKLGIVARSVGNWETGDFFPSIKHLIKLSEMFGTSIDWILKGV